LDPGASGFFSDIRLGNPGRLKLGQGGDRRISELLGLDPHTVAKGRRELVSQDEQRERVRQAGGGRKPTEKKRRK
jgi:hypothetical protein